VSDSLSRAFGRTVRRRREALSLSQEKLAALAGIHRTYVSSIELGKVRVGLEIAKKVANGLNVSLAELIGEAERELARQPAPRGKH
jgi:transcriptional regulator with XRE-family HTH domain